MSFVMRQGVYMSIHKYELFADYFQLYLMDEKAEVETGDIWSEEAMQFKLGIAKNTIAVGTLRNVDVPFEVEVLESAPEIDLNEWDHIAEGFFSTHSGKCVVMGCTDYEPEASRLSIKPGTYSVLSLAKRLDSITTEWDDADDLYKVILWPSDSVKYQLIKEYESA